MSESNLKLWLGLLALIVGGLGCGRLSGEKPGTQAEKDLPPVPVEVAPVRRGSIQEVIHSTGRLEAEADVRVVARTSNRVTDLRVEEGDRVGLGTVLVRLEDDLQRTQLAKAETRLERMREEFARIEALHRQELISEQVFSDTRFELRQADLAVEDARRELDFTEVRAPIAGTVTLRLVKPGDLVNLGQHLFDIVDFESLVVRLHLPDRHLKSLRTDQAVRVLPTALGGQVYEGYVRRIAPTVDARTGTVRVTVGFREVGLLRPGMYVRAELVTAVHAEALLVSKQALVYDQDFRFVYRLKDDRTVERLRLEARLEDDFQIEPLEGFAEGDLIVVAGQTGLKDGARVRLPGDPAEGAGAASGEGGPAVAGSAGGREG